MNNTKYSVDFEDFYHKAPCGFLTCDGEGRIVGINDTLLKWIGSDRGAIEGLKTLSALLTTGSRIFAETHIMPLLKMQGYINEISLGFLGAEETVIPCLVSAYRSENLNEGEEYYRLTITDYAARKRFELELIEAKKDAEQSAKRLREVNEDLERFAYIASHDLQAPLNNISGLLQIIEMNGLMVKNAQAEQIFEMIKRSSVQMKMMINDLLEYRRLDRTTELTKPVSLSEVCAEALGYLAADIQATDAVFNIAENLPIVHGVHIQLVRLFQNLFSNALKYRSALPPTVEVIAEDLADKLLISVSDNGRGFDPAKADVIFGFMERLHTKEEIEGTGLGLTACKRIVETHGGRIWAESEPGMGSVFFVELPKV